MTSQNIQFEFRRKLFHLIGLLIPIFYLYLSRSTAVAILGSICVFYVIFELFRNQYNSINRIYLKITNSLLRKSELYSPAGIIYFLIGCWLTIVLFNKFIAITAILLFIFSDLAAALIGNYIGRVRIIYRKTLEGFLAAWITALIILGISKFYLLPNLDISALLIVSLLTATLELVSKGNWDNLIIPVGTGLGLFWIL